MIRKNKWKLLASSIITLLPIAFGLIFWSELPEQMTTHWGADGNADGWSGRFFAVFAIPLIILAVHWICIFITAMDPKNEGQNSKVFGIVIWITPLISVFANGMVYAVSFGKEVQPYVIVSLLMGIMFIVIGNYLPKCKQNYTIGIKIKWTLENEENWNATHRLGGKIWVLGGLLMLVSMLLPAVVAPWVLVASMIVLVVLPVVYSYAYHKKQVREGTAVITPLPKNKTTKIAMFIMVLVMIFLGVIMFTGDIDVKYQEESFTIEADYWKDLTVEYEVIESVEYRDSDDKGSKTNGFNSARLLLGTFNNNEFGNYTRYSYTGCDACVVLHGDGKELVISGKDAESTKAIYEKIKSNME